MSKPKVSSLEKLKAQQAKLAARIQAAEARAKVSERKQETRRKILVGSYYLDEARKNNKLEVIKEAMSSYLKREGDRALFDLSTITE
jgi:hypothetical protein